MPEIEQVILLLMKVNKNLKKIRKQLQSQNKMQGSDNPADWGLMEDVLKQLSISKSSLYRYRQQKKVRWDQKGGISYYYLPDLLKLKYHCMK